MTREERKDKRRQELENEKHNCILYENGIFIDRFPSHTQAKNALHKLLKEAEEDMLDIDYKIKRV